MCVSVHMCMCMTEGKRERGIRSGEMFICGGSRPRIHHNFLCVEFFELKVGERKQCDEIKMSSAPPQEVAFEGGFPVGALTMKEGGMWGAGEDSHPAKH